MKLKSITVKTDKKGIPSLWVNGQKFYGDKPDKIAKHYKKAKRLMKSNEVIKCNFFQTIPFWDGPEYAQTQIHFVMIDGEPFIVDLRYINKERNINASTLLDFLFFEQGEVGKSEMYSTYCDAFKDALKSSSKFKGAKSVTLNVHWP